MDAITSYDTLTDDNSSAIEVLCLIKPLVFGEGIDRNIGLSATLQI
jgi:hypothetical protein